MFTKTTSSVALVLGLSMLAGFLLWSPHDMQTHTEHTQHATQTTTVEQTQETIEIRVTATHELSPTMNGPQAPDGPDSHWFYSAPVQIPSDVAITGFSVAMEGADESVLHHVSVGIPQRTPLLCPEHVKSEDGWYEIYSTSRHTLDKIELPAPYGIFLQEGEHVVVEFMAHPQAMPHGAHSVAEDITPTLLVTLDVAEDRTTDLEYIRLRLDDSPCVPPLPHQAFVVPTTTTATPYTKTADGNESGSIFFPATTTIVFGGANFWPKKGGQNVTVFLNDQEVDRFLAEPTESVAAWNIPFSYDTIPVPASSTVSITATYINPFDSPILDASGMYGLYFVAQ